jgi:hypothetical protein
MTLCFKSKTYMRSYYLQSSIIPIIVIYTLGFINELQITYLIAPAILSIVAFISALKEDGLSMPNEKFYQKYKVYSHGLSYARFRLRDEKFISTRSVSEHDSGSYFNTTYTEVSYAPCEKCSRNIDLSLPSVCLTCASTKCTRCGYCYCSVKQ